MKLEDLLGDILDLHPAELTDDLTQSVVQRWDSLAHINIILGLEEIYGVTFSTEEIPAIKSLGDMRRLLRLKGVAV